MKFIALVPKKIVWLTPTNVKVIPTPKLPNINEEL